MAVTLTVRLASANCEVVPLVTLNPTVLAPSAAAQLAETFAVTVPELLTIFATVIPAGTDVVVTVNVPGLESLTVAIVELIAALAC